jgi:hypothetical protein
MAGCGQVNHRFNTRKISAFLADGHCRALQEAGIEVATGWRWPEVSWRTSGDIPNGPRRFPDRHVALHHPGRGRVARRMPHHIIT